MCKIRLNIKKNSFYVYLHIKLTNGEPFYVGKGSGRRKGRKSDRSEYWKRLVNKYGYDIILLEENLTEKKAFELENYWINRIGRKNLGLGTLINLTNGFYSGISGRIINQEFRDKMSRLLKNKPKSISHRANLSKALMGNKIRSKYFNILQLDKNDNFIKMWKDTSDIGKEFNCNPYQIVRVLNGERKSYKGFKWVLSNK